MYTAQNKREEIGKKKKKTNKHMYFCEIAGCQADFICNLKHPLSYLVIGNIGTAQELDEHLQV